MHNLSSDNVFLIRKQKQHQQSSGFLCHGISLGRPLSNLTGLALSHLPPVYLSRHGVSLGPTLCFDAWGASGRAPQLRLQSPGS